MGLEWKSNGDEGEVLSKNKIANNLHVRGKKNCQHFPTQKKENAV